MMLSHVFFFVVSYFPGFRVDVVVYFCDLR